MLNLSLFIAALAQLVEQLLRKEKVVSSTPTSGTTNSKKVVWDILDDLFFMAISPSARNKSPRKPRHIGVTHGVNFLRCCSVLTSAVSAEQTCCAMLPNVVQNCQKPIRNEKVGCSIHLSGTNTDKGSLL